jgi:Fe-Mn family superoxide dismutase
MNTADQTLPIEPASAMALALSSSFGSMPKWCESFVATARAHAGESGRVELAFEPATATLVNHWLAIDSGSATMPVLAVTVPVSADADPVAFITRIDWPTAYQRYTDAVHAASAPFAAQPADVGEPMLLDVRRAGVFEVATTMLPGAAWRDPACVPVWAGQLPVDREVIVYCVYGHEVGRVTAMRLQALGVNARFLDGGIDAWQRAGHRTMPKGEAS